MRNLLQKAIGVLLALVMLFLLARLVAGYLDPLQRGVPTQSASGN
jgi:hypothetical protein